MPEFILDTRDAPAGWAALDDFAKGFVEALFFCESSCIDSDEFWTRASQRRIREGQADGNIPRDAGVCDVPDSELQAIAEFCADFQTRAADLLREAYGRPDYDETRAGRDLYFTFAGHGTGFWDRAPLEMCANPSEDSLGDKLSKAAGRGEVYAYAKRSRKSPSGFSIGFEFH